MKALMGTSFTAQLYSITEGFRGPVAFSQGEGSIKSGWMLVGTEQAPGPRFRFDFLSDQDDRFHYAIRGAQGAGEYQDAHLGVSQGGYAGLYHVAAVHNEWKIDFSGHEDDQTFWLRDYDGFRLGVLPTAIATGSRYSAVYVSKERVLYLNVREGTVLQLVLLNPEPLI
ncbi:hypothetical protein RAM80_08620 [Pseudomonas sp. App30]|uniref:hypothetical protein n=1 Tax=Pseudomonas sp. App30 TaxID=3068990 RepID=UPI003A7F6E2F